MKKSSRFYLSIFVILCLFSISFSSDFIFIQRADADANSTDTVLIFDSSGSMEEYDTTGISKLEAAQRAGVQILNVIEAEHDALSSSGQVGLVNYDSSAEVLSELTPDIRSLQDVLMSMYAGGRTAMSEGLSMAIDLFSASQGNKVIILLTDGLPNVSMGFSSDANQEVLDLAAQAGQQGICVNTVGFGDPNKGIDSIDENFLREVAAASGCGEYFNAINAIELANVYVELRHASTGNVQFKQSGQISQGDELDLGTIAIPEYQEMFLLTVNWPGSRLQPVLTDPLGVIVDNSYPGISIAETTSLISYILNNPPSGDWALKLLGIDIPEGITNYNAILSTRAGVIPTPTIAPTQVILTQVITPVPPPSGGGGVGPFLIILALAAGGIAIYVYSNAQKKKREKEVLPKSTGAKIRGEKGEYRENVIPIRDGFVIGRGSFSDLKFNDSSISRRHLLFRYSQGKWFVQDLGSSSGTYVNGKRVEGIKLDPGDHIAFGSNVFTFLVDKK